MVRKHLSRTASLAAKGTALGARWLLRLELAVTASVVLMGAAIWTFAELADEVDDGETTRFDESVLRSLRLTDTPEHPVGPRQLWAAAEEITALGGWSVLLLVVLLVTGFLAITRKYLTLVLVVVSVLGGQALSSGLKVMYGRARPSVVPHLTEVSTASFPSGHAMMSAVVYLTLAAVVTRVVERKRERFYIYSTAALLTIIVGLSRVYLGVHYPTDVAAGWAAGLSWALACGLVARLVGKRFVKRGPKGGTAIAVEDKPALSGHPQATTP